MIGKKFCPRCKSEDIMMVAGGVTGTWMCKSCGYSGSIFPEKEIVGGDLNDKKSNDGGKKE
jgi:transposase-like protein